MEEGEAKRMEEGVIYRGAESGDDKEKTKNANGMDLDLDAKENQHDNETKAISVSAIVEKRREQEEEPVVKQKSRRVATLDAFRGLTIVVCNMPLHFIIINE